MDRKKIKRYVMFFFKRVTDIENKWQRESMAKRFSFFDEKKKAADKRPHKKEIECNKISIIITKYLLLLE